MIIHEMEQGKPEWFALKNGKPSSSNFGRLITGTGKPSTSLMDYAEELAMEKYLGVPIDDGFKGNKYTDRGTELEPLSAADYEMTRQVKIRHVGFITDDLMRWGASTDGLINEDGIAEFKNLIAKTFWKLLIATKKANVTPPSYIPQIQGELFVTGREWCDIVFYHPQFKPIIHRHYPDLEFHKTLEKQLKKVITERNRILKLIKS